MPQYFCRVQLEGKPPEDSYERLHTAMEQKGFQRTIIDGAGIRFSLPHAEYFHPSGASAAAITELAKAAAATIQPNYFVLVSQASDWSGFLRKV